MKKYLLSLTFLFVPIVFAQVPPGVVVDYSVENTSHDNRNAQSMGAAPGDVLRYKLEISSPSENITNFLPVMDVTQILAQGELIDTGFGQLNGNMLEYPLVNGLAPYQSEYTFFMRVNQPCRADRIVSTALGQTTNVPLSCDGEPLSSSGPAGGTVIALAVFMLGLWGLVHLRRA